MLHTQTRCRSVHVRGVTAEQKTLENQDWAVGRRALGPLGRGGPAFSKTRFTAQLAVNHNNKLPLRTRF